jgi:CRISPR-associated protein Cas2
MQRKRREMSFAERIKALGKAGLKHDDSMRPDPRLADKINGLEREDRLRSLLELLTKNRDMKPGNVLTFIMYDIENNRIRRYIAKYLEKQGYVRVQKSVFFGNVSRALHKQVCETLKEVNEKYENGDSIMFLPISHDMFSSLKVVGRDLDYELAINDRSTLFV